MIVSPGPEPTLLERMTEAGINEANARAAIAAAVVCVGEQVITDPLAPAPHPLAVVIIPWRKS